MSLVKDKSFTTREAAVDDVLDAVQDALDLITARLDAMQYQLDGYWAVIDAPLSPTEAIHRLRRLRDEIR